MSATNELCRLLGEAGVEWTRADDGTVRFNDSEHWFYVWTYSDGLMCVSMGYLTPEQAVEATLGRGTCHLEEVASYGYPFKCSECKAWYGVDILRGELRFCPNCGRRVVNE